MRDAMQKAAADGEVDARRQQEQILEHYERELRAMDRNITQLEKLTDHLRETQGSAAAHESAAESAETDADLRRRIAEATESARENQEGWIGAQTEVLEALRECEERERENRHTSNDRRDRKEERQSKGTTRSGTAREPELTDPRKGVPEGDRQAQSADTRALRNARQHRPRDLRYPERKREGKSTRMIGREMRSRRRGSA
jgi:hypothetical protein